MNPILTASSTCITAKNSDGEQLIKALKTIINNTDPNHLIEIGLLIKDKPKAISKALKYKHLL